MVWLPDGEKISKISLFVLTSSTNVTDTHTLQTPYGGYCDSFCVIYAASLTCRFWLGGWMSVTFVLR